MRKPRSDSVLANLQPQQRDALADQLLDGLSYADAKEWLHMEYSLETSASAIAGFYQHFCTPLRLRRASEAANALPELSGGLMANWDEASVALVKQRYFELLAAPAADPKSLAVFAMQIGDINRGRLERDKLAFNRQKHEETQRLKEQDLALQREKFEFDAVKKAIEHAKEIKTIAGNRSLSSETQINLIRRRLFPQLAEEVQP